MSFQAGVRYAVFSIKKNRNGSTWVRAGSAWVNRDGSMNVYLDVLPLDGTLHVREDKGGRPVKEPKEEPQSREPFSDKDEEIPF